MRILFFMFILVPLLEMIVLIKVGGVIGVLPTIGLVCLTATIGVTLIRAQGLSAMTSAQKKVANGEVPAKELVDGLSLIIGGAMLLTPGFVTDSIGFVFLIPVLRQFLFHGLLTKLLANGQFVSPFGARHRNHSSSNTDSHVIQGEYTRDDENPS